MNLKLFQNTKFSLKSLRIIYVYLFFSNLTFKHQCLPPALPSRFIMNLSTSHQVPHLSLLPTPLTSTTPTWSMSSPLIPYYPSTQVSSSFPTSCICSSFPLEVSSHSRYYMAHSLTPLNLYQNSNSLQSFL